MGGVSLKPDRPRVYLDWSHLVKAFHATSSARQALRRVVEDCGLHANLVISDWHIIEMLNHADRRRTVEIAAWLESIDHVWMVVDRDRLPIFEACQCLLKLSGLSGRADSELFSPSITWALAGKHSLEAMAELMEDPTIRGVAKLTHGRTGRSMNGLRQVMLNGLVQLRKDEHKRKTALGTGDSRQRWSDRRFVNEQLAPWLEKARRELVRNEPKVRTVDEIVSELNDRTTFEDCRYLWISDLALRALADNIQSIPDEDSLALDLKHLVGAAYCDVFTCDRRMMHILERLPRTIPRPTEHHRDWIAGSAAEVAGRLEKYLTEGL